jgi:hypothetical protein
VQFGVSRERVRQWHAEYLPDGPRGLERRRLCQLQHARRRLLADDVFRAFYRHARTVFAAEQVALIRTREGLRARSARIAGKGIVIKKARRRSGRRPGEPALYVLSACRRPTDFVFYHLDDRNFLCVPFTEVPASGTTYLDVPTSKYQPYRNTFAAIAEAMAPAPIVEADAQRPTRTGSPVDA